MLAVILAVTLVLSSSVVWSENADPASEAAPAETPAETATAAADDEDKPVTEDEQDFRK